MNKTGTVYVNNKLKSLNKDYYFKHHKLPSKETIYDKNCIKFGTLRDPWSWYVSLWSYGCKSKTKSGIYNNLTRFRPFKSYGITKNKVLAIFKKQIAYFLLNINCDTNELYSDVSNPNLFRKWLNIVLSDKFSPIVDYQLYNSKLYNHCGLFTKRILKFYFVNHRISDGIIDLSNGLKSFLEENCYIDEFLVTDKLDSDLKLFFEKYKFHLDNPYLASKKSNSSSKNINHYDDQSFELVLKKEKIILDYFLDKWNINLSVNMNAK